MSPPDDQEKGGLEHRDLFGQICFLLEDDKKMQAKTTQRTPALPKMQMPAPSAAKKQRVNGVSKHGLQNIGNSCCVNAPVQLLLSGLDLSSINLDDMTVSYNVDGTSIDQDIGSALLRVAKSLEKGFVPHAELTRLRDCIYQHIRRTNNPEQNPEQQDASEILQHLLNAIRFTCVDGKPLSEYFDRSSLVVLEKLIQCGDKARLAAIETFTLLNVAMSEDENKTESVQQMMDRELRQRCSVEVKCQCGKKSHTIFYSFQSAPDRLTISLKRWKSDGGKLASSVDIQERLRLQLSDDHLFYLLHGVLLHIGDTPQSGHYITVKKVNGTWAKFDDCTVTTIGNSDDLMAWFDADASRSRHAYIFDYWKTDGASFDQNSCREARPRNTDNQVSRVPEEGKKLPKVHPAPVSQYSRNQVDKAWSQFDSLVELLNAVGNEDWEHVDTRLDASDSPDDDLKTALNMDAIRSEIDPMKDVKKTGEAKEIQKRRAQLMERTASHFLLPLPKCFVEKHLGKILHMLKIAPGVFEEKRKRRKRTVCVQFDREANLIGLDRAQLLGSIVEVPEGSPFIMTLLNDSKFGRYVCGECRNHDPPIHPNIAALILWSAYADGDKRVFEGGLQYGFEDSFHSELKLWVEAVLGEDYFHGYNGEDDDDDDDDDDDELENGN